MQDWLINVINQFGYAGIAFLILLENVFPPIPSELILTFSGFLTTISSTNMWLASLSATVGSMAGAILLYVVGRVLPQQRILRFVEKNKRILHLKTTDLQRSSDWMARRGGSAVFLCRFIPVVRSLISIPAGASRMKMWKFLLYSLLGTAIWNTILIYLGALAGDNWQKITDYMNTYAYVIVAAAAVVFLLFIIRRFYKKKRRKSNDALSLPERESDFAK